MPRPIAARVVRKLYGSGLSRRHVEAVLDLAAGHAPSAAVDVGGATVRRVYDTLTNAEAEGTFEPVTLQPGESKPLLGTGLRVRCDLSRSDENFYNSFTTFLLNSDIIYGMIIVRPRQTGDALCKAGRGCTKTLKKLFIEEKIPAAKRGLVPVVADRRGVLAVYGLGVDQRALPSAGHPVLKITFEENI